MTYFGQFLAGAVRGGESGVVRSTGGFAFQPGIGADYGAGFVAARLQIDYTVVRDGFVYDERVPGYVDKLTDMRVLIGATLRTPSW